MELQIENISTCSAACHFCVYPKLNRKGNSMPMALYRKIVGEAAQSKHIDTVKITGLGEPTLDPLLEERIRLAKEAGLKTEIFSNGSHLTPARFDSLKEAGLNSLVVSLNAVRQDQHEAIMGLVGIFDRTCSYIEYAIANRGDMSVLVRAVYTGDTFTYEDAKLFKERWGICGDCVAEGNWSGDNRKRRDFDPNEACHRALNHIYVMYDGRVSTCCFDPAGKQVFGDLNTQTLQEVYSSEKYYTFREDHYNDEAAKYEICANCTRI